VVPVRISRLRFHQILLLSLGLILLTLGGGCKRGTLAKHTYMYVSAPETSLRDRVATMYSKVGTARNGDRVEVLEKQRRFLRVRTDAGQEGWIEERSLVLQEIFDEFQKLAQESKNLPVEAHGATRAELNMHVIPSREGEHLYQLKDGEKLEILKRTTAEKNPPKGASAEASKSATTARSGPAPAGRKTAAARESTAKPLEPPPPIMEDWYLVRNSAGHVGWVLMRMVDLDIPLEVAQYAEGQRITGYFVLDTVPDQDKQVPQYLVLLNEPKDGIPWDYNQIRVFTWNRARHRYETAYREHNLEGYFPVSTGRQDFDKEGVLPTFTIRKKNSDGQMADITYKLNGPIVRRLLTPEQEAAEKANREAVRRRVHPKRGQRRKHKRG
jgi:Bacterial SH3 domain/GW (Gly-Tryp) dipeptide domain